MRMFLPSLALACLLTLPALGQWLDLPVPGGRWLGIPADGLAYMLIFFHELGHTAAFWLFGYPALPTFDFAHGGGYTYAMARAPVLFGFLWIGTGGAAFWFWRQGVHRPLIWLAAGLALHTALNLTDGHMVVVSFAGHAAEVLVGAFCLLRAFWNTTSKTRGAAERWLNMVFGCFVMTYDTVFTAGLIFSGDSRHAYAGQKGGHLEGDLDRIALALGVPMPAVAGFLLLFTLCVFALAVHQGIKHAPRPTAADSMPRRQTHR